MERERQLVGPESPAEAQVFAHPKTYQFLRAAVAEEAHLKIPPKTRPKDWVNLKNMLAIYLLTDNTFSDIAKTYGVTRQNCQQKAQLGLRKLWNNCSEETKMGFPLEEIPLGKPLSPKTKERMSSPQKAEPVTVGQRKINEELGLRLKEAESESEIEELFSQVKIGFYLRQSQGEKPLLVPISRMAKKYFSYHNADTHHLADSLRADGIPVGKLERLVKSGSGEGAVQRYYFLLARHQDRAREVLANDPKLKEVFAGSVEQVRGPKADKLPSTHQMEKGEDFNPPSLIFREFGIGLSRKLSTLDILTPDCPVPIFRSGHSFAYPAEKEDELRAFIQERIYEMNLGDKGKNS